MNYCTPAWVEHGLKSRICDCHQETLDVSDVVKTYQDENLIKYQRLKISKLEGEISMLKKARCDLSCGMIEYENFEDDEAVKKVAAENCILTEEEKVSKHEEDAYSNPPEAPHLYKDVEFLEDEFPESPDEPLRSLKQVSPVQSAAFTCNKCNKSFAKKAYLKQHMKSKNYNVNLCHIYQ